METQNKEDPQELVIHGAQLTLGDRQVLRQVDLAIAKGQLLALLGASGCGKTSLLRAIAGLATLDGGRILIAGRDVTTLSVQQRGVGVVFQHYALFPNLSVLENIKFGLLADGQPQAQATARSRELLELVELQAHADKLPAQLSGGQRQRVALARALARKPSLLLLDEPFSALDESLRLPLRRSFRRLQRELGQTCLLVTHDREEALELADQVAVMFEGRIAQCAPPLELWRAPASRQVADFLGAFNRMDARHIPEPLRSQGGHWVAPIAALELGEALSGALGLKARLLACYTHQHRLVLELQTAEGESLVLWAPHEAALPEIGSELSLRLPLAALRHLPD
ncbi:MAG TPA: ABC transporter ATP-binding protein [Burkholderiaceae bacterium]|jgi:ABC-type Fe3+/spermidine/putrescine transport system ATPase subunit